MRGVLRACIAAGIAVAVVRKGFEKGKGEVGGGKGKGKGKGKDVDLSARLRVEVLDVGKRYHDWWVVPKVTALA